MDTGDQEPGVGDTLAEAVEAKNQQAASNHDSTTLRVCLEPQHIASAFDSFDSFDSKKYKPHSSPSLMIRPDYEVNSDNNHLQKMDVLPLPVIPTCHDCLCWSEDGALALGTYDNVYIFVCIPLIRSTVPHY